MVLDITFRTQTTTPNKYLLAETVGHRFSEGFGSVQDKGILSVDRVLSAQTRNARYD